MADNIAAQLAQAFEDFKRANDERLAELEKGRTDPVIEAKVDAANADVARLEAALDETNRNVGRLTVGGSSASEDMDEVRHNARLFVGARTGKPVDDLPDAAVQQYRAYRDAFRAYVRRGGANGEMLPEGIRAELSVGSDPDGGYWVPTELSQTVIKRLFETSDVRSVANVVTISTDSLEMPTDTNQSTSGGWVGEKESRSETATPQVGVQRIVVHEQYAEPHITQKLLDDAAINVEGWLAEKTADILIRTENTAFVSGSGSGRPRGFLDYKTASVTTADGSRAWGVLQHVTTGAAGAFPTVSGSTASDPDKLLDVISALKPTFRGNARWFMSRATEAAVRKLKDADGRYLVGMGDLRDGATGFSLLGFSIYTMEDMPAIASDSFSIAFGDMKAAYTIVDRQGIRVLRDPYTSKPFVKFYTTRRVGGDVVNFDALKLVKFAS